MAHERGYVTVAPEEPGHETSAEELQRLLTAKRESITQTVEEIKMTMHSGYQDTKEKVSETMDWRVQMRQHPLAAVAGALALGFAAGQLLGRMTSSDENLSRSGSRRRSMGSAPTFGAGASLAPATGSGFESTSRDRDEHREPRHIIPPAFKARVGGRVEEVLSDIAENFLSEVSRVGRDVIVPTIVTNLTNAFTRERSQDFESTSSRKSTYSPKSTTEKSGFAQSSGIHGPAAGGPINTPEDKPGNGFEGRGI